MGGVRADSPDGAAEAAGPVPPAPAVAQARMDCNDFIATFGEYRDGTLGTRERGRVERHLERCASCGRYARVLEEGVRALRARPPIPVPADFRPRLTHRLYHLDDGDVLGSGSSGSGVSALTAVGMSLLLTAVAWSPVIRPPEPEVSVPPIVVRNPPAPVAGLTLPVSAFFPDPGPLLAPGSTEALRQPRALLPAERRPLEDYGGTDDGAGTSPREAQRP